MLQLKNEIDRLRATSGEPTVQEAYALACRLAGKKKLSPRQVQELACELGTSIVFGNTVYPPVPIEVSKRARRKLYVTADLLRALEYFSKAPPPADVAAVLPDWAQAAARTHIASVGPWLEQFAAALNQPLPAERTH